MKRDQHYNNALLQVQRNWRNAKYTAIYRNGSRVSTLAISNPMLADEKNLIAVVDGDIGRAAFMEIVT